jgi:hypothetical protein
LIRDSHDRVVYAGIERQRHSYFAANVTQQPAQPLDLGIRLVRDLSRSVARVPMADTVSLIGN